MHQRHTSRVMTQRLTAHLSKSNDLTRLLRGLGVGVLRIDLTPERPVLHVTDNVLRSIPLGGVIRMPTGGDTVSCSAVLDGCTLMWDEWKH